MGATRMIKNREKLFDDIAYALPQFDQSVPLWRVEVTFYKDGEVVMSAVSLAHALNRLSNDVYWDESENWAEADSAELSEHQ